MLLVMKFGGSSLKDADCVRRAVEKIALQVHSGNQVVAVVSAAGKETDGLCTLGRTYGEMPRETDALLAVGEQKSAACMALKLNAMGVPAQSFTGAQAGICTDSCFGEAEILSVDAEKLLSAIAQGITPVVAGFQGADRFGNITTLGRGGSDTTAVAIASALSADVCRIYTDVDGVYEKDPAVYQDAEKLDFVDYDKMLAMARSGAKVLHPKCVEKAMRDGIAIEVRSSFTDAAGTWVLNMHSSHLPSNLFPLQRENAKKP